MARLVLCVLALLVAGGLSDPVKTVQPKPADKTTLEHQYKLLILFYHIHEPNHYKEHQEIEKTWDLEKNANLYENATAVRIVSQILHHDWHLPKGVPFSILEPTHKDEVQLMFNVLFSAKDFDTFYKTAVYLRQYLNEYVFVYVLSTAIFHRHDTQNIIVPPLYSIIPSFFHNSEIMTTAERIAVYGKRWVEHFPSTHVWDDNVVIYANETIWPYHSEDMLISYFTHDVGLNSLYYNSHMTYPFWIGKETCPLVKDRRGELFWFYHKQIVALYYMNRLSNGLGEIPELGSTYVHQGYHPGLTYMNGIPFPYRPNHYNLDNTWAHNLLQEIELYEFRIRDAIDHGYFTTEDGKVVNLRDPEAIDLLGRIIEANADTPDPNYFKNFINLWKKLLGNSFVTKPTVYHKDIYPLVVPSVLEHYQTALRDPAFYMIWKRVLGLFRLWHEKLPHYTHEELAVPVEIQSVDVDKLVTYFEHRHFNVTNHLCMNEFEFEHGFDTKSVLVQRPQLNHKVFTVRVNVNSDAAKHVVVRFFLAPKYDSIGNEIPLPENTENFFLFDVFDFNLKQGENVIVRVSNDNTWMGLDAWEGAELFQKVEDALHGGQFMWDGQRKPDGFLRRLVLPKGRVGGMPFVLMVHISEYKAPNTVFGTGFDPVSSLGLGSGARRLTADPLLFPVDRPLYPWQVATLKNIWFHDVVIYHKHTPEIVQHHF